jgi:dynactin complex subunit
VAQEYIVRDLADELDEQFETWVPAHSSADSTKVDEQSLEEIKSLLRSQIQALRDELERIEPLYGQLGHNNPPEDARLFPIGWEGRRQVLEALDNLEGQAKTDKPDDVRIKASTSALRSAAAKVWAIAKRKVDKATDKIAETAGIAVLLEAKDAPAIYHWIVDTASSLYGKLEAVIQTADLWLKSLHLPF